MTLPVTPSGMPRDPWDRFGWVMGAIWLVFLAFPVVAAITSDRPPWVRALAVTLIAVYAAVYVHALVWLGRVGQPEERFRRGWRYAAAMTALLVLTVLAIGLDASWMATFVVALGMSVLPRRGAIAVFLAAVLASVVIAWSSGRPTSGPYTETEGAWYLVLLITVVGVATGAVRLIDDSGARHRALVRDLALTSERERVARDVHDVLGHSLTVVTVKAELAERLVDADPERAKAELAQIQTLARQSLAEIRATVGGLRSASLPDQVDAARTALSAAGIAADLDADPSAVDPRFRVVLAWALREAVTNVVRHSGAATCRIALGPDRMTVCDDGRGVRDRAEGNGLRGLRERVQAAGGLLDVGPGDDGVGTTLRVRL